MPTVPSFIPKPKKLTPENDPLHIIKTRRITHNRPATIAGPMVRYSKLPFRQLCRHFNVDIVYSPMILAREFVRNEHARMADFTTNSRDTPLIVQVGVNNVVDLLRFVEMVSPYCDGIGINCGCPIREQVREGIGSALIYNQPLLCEMVRAVKEKYKDTVRLETKIRIHDDLAQTVTLCNALASAGVDWITIHGRTRTTRSSVPANIAAIRYIKEHITDKELPIVANGDCFTLDDCHRIAAETGADGIMAVRGLLANPALFSGYKTCPWHAVELLWHYAMEFGTLPYQLLQHHLHCMLENMGADKTLLKQMMDIKNFCELIDWFDEHFVLRRKSQEELSDIPDIPYRHRAPRP
ncbi:AER075Wp [Eremothecium gossypii ATCC 10895]|uniref:tRNA-dihydrouridine synthase n=1 Tax=Eremothecium gossypii (strain ATCC 10895 / CBS 109.51 / FGSC 9923 / NRRL Y-1056) TaxID=284811 RepID=Q757D8_EREGS|nr:AER075Wp [Eremothecium gossypii ATCC 10895]AAS52759.1 AER075Wp [Eremothecium gossypii ATCC 10895]AEY97065.1 FAER075Wp [Eremothecium gossypii FDAG1]